MVYIFARGVVPFVEACTTRDLPVNFLPGPRIVGTTVIGVGGLFVSREEGVPSVEA